MSDADTPIKTDYRSTVFLPRTDFPMKAGLPQKEPAILARWEAEERGEPELAVLVVRQSDGLPGQGWWVGGAKKHGYTGEWEGPKAAKLIRTIQRQAFEFWQSSPERGGGSAER